MLGQLFMEQNLTGSQTMEQWLRCEASPGQFPGELAITGYTSNGTVFSLFMPETRVICDRAPAEGNTVPAWLRVGIVSQEKEIFSVRLPRQTLENGQFVTVRADQLQQEPERQKT
jgi:hypothetical protein